MIAGNFKGYQLLAISSIQRLEIIMTEIEVLQFFWGFQYYFIQLISIQIAEDHWRQAHKNHLFQLVLTKI